MKIEKVTVNGQDVFNFSLVENNLVISMNDIITTPVLGQICTGYYCPSEQGPKKWRIQIRSKKLAQLLKIKPHIIWLQTRKEVVEYIKQL
jgi:hypothetical protein